MSVVSSSKIIFCEGKQRSLDAQLLERVLETLPTERPTIISSGSKFTFSVFAQGYFFPQEIGNQRYLVFRDRDFDAKPSEEIRLIQLGYQPIWLTHRACIENYLLEPDLIDAYWREKYIEKQENNSRMSVFKRIHRLSCFNLKGENMLSNCFALKVSRFLNELVLFFGTQSKELQPA